MRLKKFVALAICGAVLMSGSSLNCNTARAEESATLTDATYSDDADEFEEFEDIVTGEDDGIQCGRQVHPFYKIKSSKKIKSETIYLSNSAGKTTGKTIIEYSNGKKVKCTKYDGNGKFDNTYEYTYYDNGELKEIDHVYANGIFPDAVNEYKYEYDANGRKTKEIVKSYVYENGEKIDYGSSTTTYEYDSKGNCIKQTLDNGTYAVYEYDANGNCIKSYTYIPQGAYNNRTSEYNENGDVIEDTFVKYNYEYEYDNDGDLIKVTSKTYAKSNNSYTGSKTYEYEYYEQPLTTTGIYCASNYPSIQAGINIQKSNPSDVVEYKWVGCNNNDPEHWFEVSPWTKNNNWMNWTPKESGGYVFVCYARIVGQPETEIQYAFGTEYHKQIKGICQMPYTGEGGGYLIGIESYDNPNHKYQYEMLILDCNLYMQGKDAWVYTTGKCGADGNCLWTIWQPVYGYYWTLFRIYDSSTGELIDEACYGFANVN